MLKLMASWITPFFFLLSLFPLTVFSLHPDLIKRLPGQPPNPSFNQYSGYIVTDTHHGRALFYYFVEADTHHRASRPLTLWLNGGPGCSSLGIGALMEHGPYLVHDNSSLVNNKYSWNLASNMLYVESPIGVGFSYSNTSSDYINWNDTKTAEDNLRFLINWFEKFPAYRGSDLYLTGESYAGHYIPQLAALLMAYNKKHTTGAIKLKAIALGNPFVDMDISVNSGEYLWAHGLISDQTFELEKTLCNDSSYMRAFYRGEYSEPCIYTFKMVAEEMGVNVDEGDILLPKCLTSVPSMQAVSRGLNGKIHAKISLSRMGSGDLCSWERIFKYLNRADVQRAFHANATGLPYNWDSCSGPLVYQDDNSEIDIRPLILSLLKEDIPIFLYSGDQDSKIPLTQTRIIANQLAKRLKLSPITKYAPWYDKKQVGGWVQAFGRGNRTLLTFATVRGAAHEVPFTSPSQALTLFRAFITGSPLPTS
ncbi:hypothetical protein AMTRI_Chr03g147280 [Amborella trichopoda]|uniref:Carboxypeptidase n=1 Tax=Amborella trichopoda TaxID=13333 RepID=W1P129_AMBTC|nr:serine carboxypeptidase-like 45 [Amborella trichopoda]ERN01349.1 hypothetical protein AMTR_s00002p00258640 [Amborella trichopoda]|eukprot:XP_006838780.1 serine carboxypeptidase-like 45 [Amborella trichopoda]